MNGKNSKNSKNNFRRKKKRIYKGLIFLLIIFLTIMYGYYHRLGLELELGEKTFKTFSEGDFKEQEEQGENESIIITATTATGGGEGEESQKDILTVPETVPETEISEKKEEQGGEAATNYTEETEENNKTGGEEEVQTPEIILKYFWSRFCRICVQLRVKEFLAQKKLIGKHPNMKLEIFEITEKENKEEMKKYGIIGVPSYVVVINETALILPGPLTWRSTRRVERFICSNLKDEVTC